MTSMIKIASVAPEGAPKAILVSNIDKLKTRLLTNSEKSRINSLIDKDPERKIIEIQRKEEVIYVLFYGEHKEEYKKVEAIRKIGASLCLKINAYKMESLELNTVERKADSLYPLAEGMALKNYQFIKYFKEKDKKANSLAEIIINHPQADEKKVADINAIVKYTSFCRDLVNEPLNYLNAEKMASLFSDEATVLGIKSEVFNKKKIESLKMGGLLAVNKGSIDPPTFTILEYKPENAVNEKPVILVGKGVVFDTGGMNIKTGPFMEGMKADMGGAATMASTIFAAAATELPIYLIALIPATDNRPDGNAYVPGDIITMYDNTTVEVKNTDAEGRLILADALSYAKKFDPELVINAATLTGAAMRAIGQLGIVAMENDAADQMKMMKEAGNTAYERIAEMPFWDEYAEMLKSDVADLSNLGGAAAGAITAGKFLQHFTDYPFIHLDIAGVAHVDKGSAYIPKGGTGFGIRMLIEFLSSYTQKN